MSKLKPKYRHDCKACQFLGQAILNGHFFDLYFCEQGGLMDSTLVYRRGNEGPEYGSTDLRLTRHFMAQDDKTHPSVVAYKLAQKRGLINEPATV